MGRFYRRPALLAVMTALLLGMPATALAQPVTSSPAPARGSLASAWHQLHMLRGLREPAWLAGGAAQRAGTSGSAGSPGTPAIAPLATAYPGVLEGASAVPSSTSAWAVGYACASGCGTATAADHTLILHWNGAAWSRSTSPNPSARWNELTSVAALSATNAWAVGDYCVSGCGTPSSVIDSLVLHWNGTSWSKVASKNPSTSVAELTSVTASSATSVWVAGFKCTAGCIQPLTLTEHYNGSSWSAVASPSPSSLGNELNGISVYPAGKPLAVGYAGPNTYALRWTGSQWASASSPDPSTTFNELTGVSSLSATSAWAVGSYCSTCTSTTTALRALAVRWNGTSWSKVTTPNPSAQDDALRAVTARTGTDAWAVGEDCASGCSTHAEVDHPLILHWTGSAWSLTAAPSEGSGSLALNGVAASSASSAWAVGSACMSGCGTASEVDWTLIEHWNGSTWSLS